VGDRAIVGLVRCDNYSDVRTALLKAIACIGGLEAIVKPNARVLIKPNICDPVPPERAATTHPMVVKAIIELVKEITQNVVVGEQSASNSKGITESALEISGIGEVLRDTGVRFRNLQVEPFINKEILGYRSMKRSDFSKAVFEPDVIINLPKFKTHGMTFITAGVKNCFGLIHPDERKYLHANFSGREEFSQGIIDVFSVIRPNLTIIDAVIGMEGDEGPSNGHPKKIGYVIASVDTVAADAIAAIITGHSPMAITTIKLADERGLGFGSMDRISVVGDELRIVSDFKPHSSYTNLPNDKRGAQPEINEKCVRCGICMNSCPVNAIDKGYGRYSINVDKCIRCYCCLEVCTHGAVGIINSIPQKSANIRLGLQCNHHCQFCTVADSDEGTITTEEAISKINELVSNGVVDLTFTGGEPTLRDDLTELTIYSRSKGIDRIDLQTNGNRFQDLNYVTKLKAAGLRSVTVSLHSHKKDISNRLTNSTDYDSTIIGLKNAVSAGLLVSVSHVINEDNYRELIQFARFIRGISTNIVLYMGFIRPNGRTLENLRLVPKLADIEKYLHDTMYYCDMNKFQFQVEGVPLCYMRGYERHSAETHRINSDIRMYLGKGNVRSLDLHKNIHSRLKVKGNNCIKCSLNARCVGVWTEYAQIHSTDELYPIFNLVKND
jgi:uncharacterized protein (DUF362 family)/MoaA/NifB/PqqE/SkfB family radical SAM enzyme